MNTDLANRLAALGDPTRMRLLLVLDRHELTVGELCAVLQLPQSTVSRHLKVLADDTWVVSRADGTSRQYRVPDDLDAAARRLWRVVREQAMEAESAQADGARAQQVLAERRTKSQEFFSSAAGQWDTLRGELFGRRQDLQSLLGLVDDAWSVGDLGCGTGELTAALAPFVRRVVAVDASRQMLAAAKRRVGDLVNVELRQGELEALPLDDGELDAVIVFLVLHYVPDPVRALTEIARVLKPGGKLLIVDMVPHDREELREKMGHVWPGFSYEQLAAWGADAGFAGLRYRSLPPDPLAKGPMLFTATAAAGLQAARRKVTRRSANAD
jgi:ubiquinone/menaquinone biosynthesis C-methylase UbiE/DNA-binding transcriptional ArsR family regulator